MPRIPTAQPDNSTIFGPAATKQASGQAMGAGVHAAQAQVGDALNRAALAIGNTRRSIRVGQAYSEAMAELDEVGNQLINGFQDKDGNIIEPPEPEKHSEIWDQKVVEIGEKMRAFLGDDASFRAFNNRYQQSALRASVTVRKNALVQQKEMISAEVATTLENLETMIGQAAINGDALMHNDLLSQADLMFADLVEKRVWSAEKAQTEHKKFLDNIDEAHVRGLINKDPLVAVAQLKDPEIWPNMDEKDRQKWVEVAIDQHATNVSREIADENAQHTREKRVFDKRQRQLAQEFETMALEDAEGFTPSFVAKHAAELDTTTLQYYIARAQGDNTWVTDRRVYGELLTAAADGDKSAVNKARLAYEGRKLGRAEFDKIEATYDATTKGTSKVLPDYYAKGAKIITTALGADTLNPKIGAAERSSEALERFMLWSNENPKAPFTDAIEEARALADQFQLVNQSDIAVSKGLPRVVRAQDMGSREGFDVKRAITETRRLRDAGKLSSTQYLFEMSLIKEYDDLFEENGVNEAFEKMRKSQPPPNKPIPKKIPPAKTTTPSTGKIEKPATPAAKPMPEDDDGIEDTNIDAPKNKPRRLRPGGVDGWEGP